MATGAHVMPVTVNDYIIVGGPILRLLTVICLESFMLGISH